MITGIFLIVKILCKHFFAQPWNFKFLNLEEVNHKRITPIITSYTSYLLYVVTSFYEHLPCHEKNDLLRLTEKGVIPMKLQKRNV
jgi:hypothetical protein